MSLFTTTKKYVALFDEQMSLYEDYARKNGLNGKSLQMLLWLFYSENGVTQKILANRTYSTKQVVNATIKNWVNSGLVMCVSSGLDKRQKVMVLTDKGKEYANPILQPLQEAEEFAMSQMTLKEQEQFLSYQKIFLNAMKQELEGEKND